MKLFSMCSKTYRIIVERSQLINLDQHPVDDTSNHYIHITVPDSNARHSSLDQGLGTVSTCIPANISTC